MREWALLALLAAVALACRTGPVWGTVFPGADQVRLLGGDSYYHLRHARYAVKHYPSLLRWDHATHYPAGQRARSAGLFDLALATAALPAAGRLAAVAAWFPPALALLALLVVFLLLRRMKDSWTALYGCLLLLLYPGLFLSRTLLGFVDHHAAEIVLCLWSLHGLLRCLDDATRPWWRPAVLSALPMALFLFTWAGAPIHLLFLVAALIVVAVARLVVGGDVGRLPEACARYGSGLLLLVVPTGLLVPALVMETEWFVPIIGFIAAIAALLAPALLLARRSGRPRAAAAALFTLLVGTTALAMSTGRLAPFLLAPKTSLVAEHVAPTASQLWEIHGPVPLLALLGLGASLHALRADRGRQLLAVIYSGLVFVLWWRTHDYGYAAAALLVVPAALAFTIVPRRKVVLAGVVLATVVPLGWTRRPWPSPQTVERLRVCDDAWTDAMIWLAQETPEPVPGVDEPVAPWEGDRDYPPSSYGVWSAWDFGNLVSGLGRRPAVWSQGVARHVARWLLQRDEARSTAVLDALCRGGERVRYVVLDARTMSERYLAHFQAAGGDIGPLQEALEGARPGQAGYGDDYAQSIAARLYFADGEGLSRYRLVFATRRHSFVAYVARPAGSGFAVRRRSVPIRTLEERLRFETVAQRGGVTEVPGLGLLWGGVVTPSVKVFERVAGAKVTGRTLPHGHLRATLELVLANGRQHRFRRLARADADGRYEIRVPYATGPMPGTLRAAGLLRVEVSRYATQRSLAHKTIAIEETQVQAGATLVHDVLPDRR